MPIEAPLTFDAFSLELKAVLNLYENLGLECSAATAKKIAKLTELKSNLCDEEQKKALNVVKIRKIKQDIQATETLIETCQNAVITECYQIYKNAFEVKVPIVIGNASLRAASSAQELINFGLLTHDESSCPAALYKQIEEKSRGGIFCPRSWSLVKNDAFIIGAIHGGHPFALKGPLETSDLWDESLNRPKVLSREIACLNAAGYQQLIEKDKVSSFGYLFEETTVPVDYEMRSILIKIAKVHAISDVLKILHP